MKSGSNKHNTSAKFRHNTSLTSGKLVGLEFLFGLPKNFPKRKITQALANKKLSVTQRILLFTLLSAANTNTTNAGISEVSWFVYQKSAYISKYKIFPCKTQASREGHTHGFFFDVVGESQRGLKFPARCEIFVPTNL